MDNSWITKVGKLWYNGEEKKVYYVHKNIDTVIDQLTAASRELEAFYGLDFYPRLRYEKSYTDGKPSTPTITLYNVSAPQSILDEKLPETKAITSRNDYYIVFDPTFEQRDQEQASAEEEQRRQERLRLEEEERKSKQLENPYVKQKQIKAQKNPYVFGDILKKDIIDKETKEQIQNQLFGKIQKDPKTGKETYIAGDILRKKVEDNIDTLEGLYLNILDKLSLKNIIGVSLSQLAKWLNGEPVDIECIALNFKNGLLCSSIKIPDEIPKSFKEGWEFPNFSFDLSAIDTEELVYDFLKILETTIKNIIQDLILSVISLIFEEFQKILDKNFSFNKYILPCKENSLDSIFDKQRRKSLEEVLDFDNEDFKKTFENDILSSNLRIGYQEYLSIVDETLKNLTPRELDGLYNGIISGDAFELVKNIVNKFNGNQNLDEAEYINLFTNYKKYVYDFTQDQPVNYLYICNHPSFFEVEKQALRDKGLTEDEAQDIIDTKKAAWITASKEMCNFLRNSVKKVETKEQIDPTDAYKLVVGKNIDNMFDSLEKNLQDSSQKIFAEISALNGDLSIASNYIYPIKNDRARRTKFVKNAIEQTKEPEPENYLDNLFENIAQLGKQSTFYEDYLSTEEIYKKYTFQQISTENRWIFISAIQKEEGEIQEDTEAQSIFVLDSNKILYYDKDNVDQDRPELLFNGFTEIDLSEGLTTYSLTGLLLQKTNFLPVSYRDSLLENKENIKDSDIFFEIYRAIEKDADNYSSSDEYNMSYDLFFEFVPKIIANAGNPLFAFVSPDKDDSLNINKFKKLKFLNFDKIKQDLKKELKVIK